MVGKYKTILLDVNGTLLGYDDPQGFEKRFAAACAELGPVFAPAEVTAAIMGLVPEWLARQKSGNRRASSAEQYRQAMTWFYRELLIALQVPCDPAQHADELYDRFIIREGFMPPFQETRATLEGLQARGYRMGVLTNYPPHLEDNLRRYGLHGFFDFFVVSSVVGMEKPEPAIFKLAIAKAGCPPEDILYVGDDPNDDLRGARSAGLEMVLIDRVGRYETVECPKIRRLDELLDLLPV